MGQQTTAELAVGSDFAGYRIEEVAARGGMGVVYRATQLRLTRPVALKLVTPALARDPAFRERFRREWMIAASIDHPNVIPVYEAGEEDGALFIAMRWVEGTNLRDAIDRGGLDPVRAARIVFQVGSALDAAHARDLIHRDVKPANILITGEDHVYLTDFGLTKHASSISGLTRTGQWVGTVDYTAPEQIEGTTVSPKTDVYSLGCVFYETLTGQAPFKRENDLATLWAHVHSPPPSLHEVSPETPAPIVEVVHKAMSKSPAERYASAGELGRAALAAAEGTEVPVAPPPAADRRGPPSSAEPTPRPGRKALLGSRSRLDTALDFRVLGPLEVWRGDEPLGLGAPKQRALLALLLLHRGEVVSTDRLVDELWGERAPQAAAKSVQVYVSGLRKALGEGLLETRGRGYVLEPDPGQLDAERFEGLLEKGRHRLADGDAGEAATILREALALWRGPPLADFTYDDFAQEEIARLEELRLTALEERIDADLALGRHGDLIAELTRLVGEHPLRERMRAQLMLALYRSGRQAEALELYQAGRRTLLEERGLEPGPALRELEAAILRQEPELGAAIQPRVLGRRRRGALLMAGGGGALLAVALVAAIIALGDGDDGGSGQSVDALPTANCSPVASAPGASPRLLIAANLPLGATYRSLGAEMDAAIRYVLRGRGFRAGSHTIGYQVCDESTPEGVVDDEGHCASNARAYARLQSVIAVIGPFSSTCATFQIPITNRAGLAMLSPTNTRVGLTRTGPGAEPGEPEVLYPSDRRTYARIIPDDSLQAAANGLLARRLGIRRLFLLQGLPGAPVEALLDGVDYAAARLGVRIVGRDGWDSSARDFSDLVERVRRARPDGVFLGGALNENEGTLIRDLRAALPRARLLAPDGFSATDALVDAAGSAAERMTVTISGASRTARDSRGREFVERLANHLGVTPEPYSIYAAQAADAMLDAIERSDGTRVSVVRELFRTRVRDGIVGNFSLTPEGDTTDRAVSVYRIEGGRQELFRVLTPARHLVPDSSPAG